MAEIIIANQQDFLSLIKGDTFPNGNLSIRGVARCCGVADKSIINGGSFNSSKLAQSLTGQGFEAGSLVDDGFPPQAVWLTIEYFAYESKAKAPMAKQIARTFGAIGVLTTLEKIGAIEPLVLPGIRPEQPPIDLIAAAGRAILGGIVADHLIQGAIAEATRKHYPELAGAIDEFKKLLPMKTELVCSMTVTDLAQLYTERSGKKISAVALNKLLESKGLQRSTGKKEPRWEAIGEGSEFAEMVLQTAKGSDRTCYQLRWFPSVLELLA